jgi:starch phosphorylase
MNPEVWEAINLVRGGHFSHGDRNMFESLIANLIYHDPFCLCADFDAYLEAQDEVSRRWTNKDDWNTMSLLNIAGSGFFSSDRSIKEYCETIWKI